MNSLEQFREVWAVKMLSGSKPGEQRRPVCLAALEVSTENLKRFTEQELITLTHPPYSVGKQSLLVLYRGEVELGCHLSLGWTLPENILDLFAEFRNLTNGRVVPCGDNLFGALVFSGLDFVPIVGPHGTEQEQTAHCESYSVGLSKLLSKMLPHIDLQLALLRGRYMKAVARMEFRGIPIDTESLTILTAQWEIIEAEVIRRIDQRYGVFEGRHFNPERWADWLNKTKKQWPRQPSGDLCLDDETFRQMARTDPDVAPVRELQVALSQMKNLELTVGSDGRNRCDLRPFRSRTGRNQPRAKQFIFGPSTWLRGLIQPKSGFGLVYIDWSQQEFGIAAALSGDSLMMAAY